MPTCRTLDRDTFGKRGLSFQRKKRLFVRMYVVGTFLSDAIGDASSTLLISICAFKRRRRHRNFTSTSKSVLAILAIRKSSASQSLTVLQKKKIHISYQSYLVTVKIKMPTKVDNTDFEAMTT